MTSAEQAVKNALAAVATARALRQRDAEERRNTFQRIQLASQPPLYIPRGVQLRLDLGESSSAEPRKHS